MEIWEVLRFIGSIVGGLAGIALAVIGYLLRQQLDGFKDQMAQMRKATNREVQERKVEFASIRSKFETMSDEREEGDSKLHDRVNNIEERLPREYARQDSVTSVERRLEAVQTEVKEGFRHHSTQIQQVITMLKNGR